MRQLILIFALVIIICNTCKDMGTRIVKGFVVVSKEELEYQNVSNSWKGCKYRWLAISNDPFTYSTIDTVCRYKIGDTIWLNDIK